MANKRKAEGTPSGHPHNSKLQKTKPSTVLHSGTPKATKSKQQSADKLSGAGAVIPATPGDAVKTPANYKQRPRPVDEAPPAQQQEKGEGQLTTKQPEKKQPNETKAQTEPQPPLTLTLEPHAAILKDLQSKYTVRALSVISSTSIEKRVTAVLQHLAAPATQPDHPKAPTPLPGIVLLHCRVPETNKLISIVEVVKRRMREGHFATESTGETTKHGKKKKGKNASQPSETAWFQYNRIYDVVGARKPGAATDEAEDEEHDEDFAPMVHRLEDALNAKKGPAVMTYFSTFLSRTPVAELQRNPEVSSQSSSDALEIEYQKWMANV